ncbi:hypothetical protein [Labrenzia sp. R5_0]|uniref:hypothetical protein n=1 Tax=Labrenzia sp. R5_0 TaxID=2821108 RepID=UPI001ADBBE6B|nr:hypothetical protein [Labrenzia sp. R5_0]MBO9461162.1 hypothetical protein [Labrenzia sp. R5_0]
MDDKSEPPKFVHPQKVEKALLWANSLSEEQLIARAKTRSFPAQAIVRLVRRFRLEERQNLSDALAGIVYNRAILFLSKQFSGVPESFRDQIITDAVSSFVRDLVEQDAVDFWEIDFFGRLKNRANDSYQKIKIRYENEITSEDLAGLNRDDSKLSKEDLREHFCIIDNFEDEALLKALSRRKLTEDELALLFAALAHKGVPVSSKKAAIDLVRITGFSRTKVFELWDSIVSTLNPIKEKVTNHD